MMKTQFPLLRFPALSSVATLACLSMLLAFTGCQNAIPGSPAPTVNIAANPPSIIAGSSSLLTVTATNATAVTVTGTDGSSYTLPANGGTQSVSPTVTTTYTATATGIGGSRSATTTVTVGAAAAPTVNITANPASITLGSSSTLTVTASNATQVTVAGSDGSSYTLQANGGTQSVSPTVTTTYTATATGAGGKTSATATVTVGASTAPAPTVNIAANPTSITSGSSSILTVTATNATTVTVTGTDGSSYTLQASGGTQSVSPSATTTYTATATGLGGKISATVTVTVTPNPAPTVSITANPTSITAGSSSILTVAATNAATVTLTGSDGSSYTLSVSGGTQAVTPKSTTTYTVTATGPGGTVTATASVTVTPNPPPTVTITANPASITSGNSSTLTVSTSNATQVVINGSDGSSYTLPSPNASQTVSPTKTTTYTATATGPGGTTTSPTPATVTVTANPAPTVSIAANPASIGPNSSSTLSVTATNATQVTITGTDGSSYTLPPSGGTQTVSPTSTTTYTATATGDPGTTPATAETTVTVVPAGNLQSITHVIFMLQENHTFDNYFGMLNPYRQANSTNGQAWNIGDDGNTYNVDGIDDKLTRISNTDDEGTVYNLFKFTTTCIDDATSDWLASYGDVTEYDRLTTRPILMNGFVHNAEGYAKSCAASGSCSGNFTDLTGERSMGYYDQRFLNYYYYMASQFAISDRWFSPVSSKSVSNRIAVTTGGTTQGLVKDPGSDDHVGALNIETIFQELDAANVRWKIYYSATDGFCAADTDCPGGGNAAYPATYFSHLTYAYKYLHEYSPSTPCTAPLQPSSVVGDSTNSFCIDPTHIAPLTDSKYGYFADLTNQTLASFAFIEAGYGVNDEHPGSNASVLTGQAEVANVVNAFMSSPEWKDSVFFFSYDEGGGPYDHVPPVPGHTNDYTDASQVANYPDDISTIAVNPDSYNPCVPPTPGTPTLHCDLASNDPGANPGDAAAVSGFAAQLGFRLPNIIVSPFIRRHYVSHIPMDHTAVIKFVENRFIGPNAHLTLRDAAQPNLLDFFDFTNVPWATPPTPPTPVPVGSSCTPASMGP
ncbi:MAG: alkaline phosphatase family protein [Acidobacteriaceae bacterium]